MLNADVDDMKRPASSILRDRMIQQLSKPKDQARREASERDYTRDGDRRVGEKPSSSAHTFQLAANHRHSLQVSTKR